MPTKVHIVKALVFLVVLVVKKLSANSGDVRDMGSIPGSGKGYGNPLQYSCLANPMEIGAWWAIVHGVAENQND